MLNFTVGPVMSSKKVREVGSEQVPYFRTSEFSELMFENERLIKRFAKASDDSKVVFITGSGTASMEATIINTLTNKDKAIVVNGGTFGQRFVQLLELHEIPYSEIKLKPGQALTEKHLSEYEGKGYTAFVVNVHETSTGVHYDIDMISQFCTKNGLFLIVDAISSFLADDFNMKELNVDVMITGSQKALACPPGISLIVLSSRAIKRIETSKTKCMYLDLKDALKNGERGQTPFTPAVGILRQIHQRLIDISESGGESKETQKIRSLALDFRARIKNLPFEIISESLSNAVTPLHPLTANAYDIFLTLKDDYGIWVCPNGGELKNKVFRVGHMGELSVEDNMKLVKALEDMKSRGLI